MKTPLLILLPCLFLAGCGSKTSENTSADSVATEKTEQANDSPKPSDGEDNILTIHGKDIWVRDYPNTGKVIMTLNEGDHCKIIQVGRYDVIREKGNHWYKIDFNGQTGWVFGSQTDKPSEEWSVTNTSVVFKEYSLKNLEATDSIELFQRVGNVIKKTEIITKNNSDEPEESKDVTVNTNSIETHYSSGDGYVQDENFTKGKSKDMIQLWGYYRMNGGASMYTWSNTLLISQLNSKSTIVAELPGKWKDILQLKNKRYLIVSQYNLFDMSTDHVGFIHFAIYDPISNAVIQTQQLGYSKAPKFAPQENYFYAEEVEFELKNISNILLLDITEKFTQIGTYDDLLKGTSIRHYQFNETKNLFEERGQEEVHDLITIVK